MKMWFEINGQIDVSLMLDEQVGGINTQKFCSQLVTNHVKVLGFKTSTEIEKWKNYYLDMHPKQYLTEDVLPASITDEEVKKAFDKFFKPLSANFCRVTIVDPYIFARFTNVNLLCSIIVHNVQSKKIRFITKLSNADSTIKNEIETSLEDSGFEIYVEDRSDIHDRWWYTRIKGFTCGTSFNGISRKTTMLNLFSDEDLTAIINDFGI